MAEFARNPNTGERLILDTSTNEWRPIQAGDPIAGKTAEPLTLGNTPLVNLEQGTFGRLLDTIGGGESSPENLMQLPINPESTQSDAAIGGILQGMNPAVDPITAAVGAVLPEIMGGFDNQGREDISAGDLFTVSLDKMKRTRERDQRQFGGASLMGEIAGTLPASIAITKIPAIAKALSINPARTGGVIGAGFGGAHGAGTSEDITDVPENLLKGGALGFGTGFGTGLAIDRVVSPATSVILKSFKNSRSKATDVLSNMMRDAFPDEQAAQLAAQGATKGTVLPDLSRSLRQDAQTLAGASKRFGNRAEAFLRDRAGGAIERVNSVTNKVLGTRGKDVAGTLKDLSAKRFQEFSNIIDDVYQQPVNPGKVQGFVAQIDDAIERTQGVKGFSTSLKQLKRSLFKDSKMEVLKDSHETLHLARKAYGDVVNKSGGGAKGLLTEIRNNFDDIFPADFKRANSIWSDSKKVEEAMLLGRKVLRDDVDITTDAITRMPQAERESYLIGVARAIDDVVKTPQEGGKITSTFNKPIVQERLRAAIPDETAFNEFMSRVGTENTFNLTKNAILSGSMTQEKTASLARFKVRSEELGLDNVKSNALKTIFNKIRGLRGDKNLNISDDVVDALSDELLTAGKVTPELVTKLMKTPAREIVSDLINLSIAPVSAAGASQAGELSLGTLPPL